MIVRAMLQREVWKINKVTFGIRFKDNFFLVERIEKLHSASIFIFSHFFLALLQAKTRRISKLVNDEAVSSFLTKVFFTPGGQFMHYIFFFSLLAAAYHENAMMSMQAYFTKQFADDTTKSDYIPESRNLNFEPIAENPGRRDRLLHQKRTQIIGFLDKLPKTQHDLTSFTLDVPFATDR